MRWGKGPTADTSLVGFRGHWDLQAGFRSKGCNPYGVPYPHLSSQAGPGGVTRRPTAGPLRAVLYPLLSNVQPEAPGTTPIDPSPPFVWNNGQQRVASVYYLPRQNCLGSSSTRSSPPSKFRSRRKMYTTSPSALTVLPAKSR